MHTIKFFPIGNAESFLITLAQGDLFLFDYANELNVNDPNDLRIDLAQALRNELEGQSRDSFDVVAFTHLDDDHICKASEFFHFDHTKKYQGEGRIKIDTLWVPAAAIIETRQNGEAAIIQAEAKHRLKQGYGIRVFSRPKHLEGWLNRQGLTLDERRELITDAGQFVPGYDASTQGVEFFVHSPFASRLENGSLLDRNTDALVMQAKFVSDGIETYFLITADLPCEAIAEIVKITKYHGNEDKLTWDIVDIPHHCSYLSLAPEKDKEVTAPIPEVKWLYEEQCQPYGKLVSSSKPIPGNDDDNQPPHRQAANYYRACANTINGEFLVTMEYPTKSAPEPLVITIDRHKATIVKRRASAAAVATNRSAPRAG